MITYEVLKNLESSCLDLLMNAVHLDGLKEDELDKLTKAYRKIVIAAEMLDRNIICITGNQGAGKTTLVKNYYGLNDDYFNISLGRGEKLPVLITERAGCKTPEMKAACLKKDGSEYKRTDIKIDDKKKFRQISSGEEGVSQDTHIMYLELTVPSKYFGGGNFSIMLLPGFERKRDYWQTLIELSVNCCDSAIFVFDEANLSRNDNKKLLDQIKSKFGKNAIYAISHSDTSQDGNEAVKKTCMEVMGIEPYESDRVVCVGAYSDPEKNKKWINNLNSALEKYCNTSSEALNNNKNYIAKIIFNDLKPLIRTIRTQLSSKKTEELFVKLENNEFLSAFDYIKNSRRNEIQERLQRELEKAKGKTIANLEKNMLTKDSESIVKKIPRAIFGSNKIKLIQEARQRVFEALQDENGTFYHQQAFVDAIEATQASLKDSNKVKEFLLEDYGSGFAIEEKEYNSEGENQLAISDETLKTNAGKLANDVRFFMTPNSGMNRNALQCSNPKTVLEIIADVSAKSYADAVIYQAKNTEGVNVNISTDELSGIKIDGNKLVKNSSDTVKVIFTGLGVTGLDVIPDGVFNIVTSLATGLGVSLPIAATLVGSVFAVAAGTAIYRDLNKCSMPNIPQLLRR